MHFMLKKSLIIIARIHTLPVPGAGTFPATDHCGQPWRDPWRSSRAGKALAGPYIGVLEGIEGDQDFIRLCFQLQRHAARQSCCYFCRARDVQTSVRFIGFKRPTQVNRLGIFIAIHMYWGPEGAVVSRPGEPGCCCSSSAARKAR